MIKSSKSIRNKKNIILIVFFIILIIIVTILLCKFSIIDTKINLFDILKINNTETEEASDESNEDNSNDSSGNDNGNNQGTENDINNSTSASTSTESDPYEGWKFFESDECKIGLYYPSNWYILTYNDGVRCFYVSTTADPSGSKGVENPFLMMVGINNTTAEKYINNLKSTGSTVTVDKMLVDGIERPYVIQATELLGTYYYLFYESSNKKFVISWSGTGLSTYQGQIDKLINSIDIK